MREHPGQRELDHRHPRLGGERAHRLDRLELALAPVTLLVALGRGAQREARARRGAGLPLVLAAEKTAGQRVVGNDREPLGRAEREQLALDLAGQ